MMKDNDDNKIIDDDDHECPGLPIVDEAGGEVRGER